MGSILQPGFLFWDGLKYIIISTAPATGTAGGDLSGTYPNPQVTGISGIPVTQSPAPTNGQVLSYNSGSNRLMWTAAGLSGYTLVYQPGGTTAGNVYASWTALMAVRATIHGPAVIAIDNSIENPAVIDPGTWDLTNNTAIVGNSYGVIGTPDVSAISIGDGTHADAQLLNPVWFQDITVITLNNTLPAIDVSGGLNKMFFDCYNVTFINFSSNKTLALINIANIDIITLGGFSGFDVGLILGGSLNPNIATLNVNDNSQVEASTISFTSDTQVLDVNINGVTASCSNTQVGQLVFKSGNLSGGWTTASSGFVLTWTGVNQATWMAAAGGSGPPPWVLLNNAVPNYVVPPGTRETWLNYVGDWAGNIHLPADVQDGDIVVFRMNVSVDTGPGIISDAAGVMLEYPGPGTFTSNITEIDVQYTEIRWKYTSNADFNGQTKAYLLW